MMQELLFYRCAHCGAVHANLWPGAVTACCGAPMERLLPNGEKASLDRHLPYVEIGGDTVTCRMGIEPHEMTQEHSIQWLCLETVRGFQWKRMTLGEDEIPSAEFKLADDLPTACYGYCNLHGLWKTSI